MVFRRRSEVWTVSLSGECRLPISSVQIKGVRLRPVGGSVDNSIQASLSTAIRDIV